MLNHYHGYTTSALMSEVWPQVYKHHRGDGAWLKIAELAFDIYHEETLPQYRNVTVKDHDDPFRRMEAKAKKIDDFAKESRSVRWTDGFECYVARAIDKLYGYNYEAILKDILFPRKPIATSTQDIHELFRQDQKETAECNVAVAEKMLDGLHNDSIQDLLSLRREVSESHDIKGKYLAIIDTELARRKSVKAAG